MGPLLGGARFKYYCMELTDNTIIMAEMRGSRDFNVQPIVTCDDIVIAKMHGSRSFDVRPIVTCDDAIITTQGRGLKAFGMWARRE